MSDNTGVSPEFLQVGMGRLGLLRAPDKHKIWGVLGSRQLLLGHEQRVVSAEHPGHVVIGGEELRFGIFCRNCTPKTKVSWTQPFSTPLTTRRGYATRLWPNC